MDDGSCRATPPTQPKTGSGYELPAVLIDDLPRNGGEAALDGIVDIVKLSQKLPAEQFQAAMLSVQAMMGPMKLVVSVVAHAAAEAVAGDQYREFKESKAIELAAKLTDRTVETMREFHAEAKADSDNLLHGDEYVVATEFLMDAVLGEVKSLAVKGGSKIFANDSKGKEAVETNHALNAAKGVVASRVNVRTGTASSTGSGLEYAWKKHGGAWGENKSAFTISKDELKIVLQTPQVVKTPAYQSPTSGNFIRTVDMGRPIGVDAKTGGQSTSFMTVITDSQGNLVNTFPGKTF